MARTHRRWVRPLNAVRRPAARVVCFPHSGGSAGGFAPWSAALPPDVELMAVQYPGRGDRFGEEPLADVSALSAPVAEELLALEPLPCKLFGHSLGALVAYETALLLRDRGAPPRQLLVSGSPAPRRAGGGRTHLASDQELWSAVCGLGGVEPDTVHDVELRDVVLPALRSDVRASESYRPRDVEPLSCPVRAYHGAGDPLVSEVESRAWAEVTTGRFTAHTRPGGHFHVWVDVLDLVDDLVGAGAAT